MLYSFVVVLIFQFFLCIFSHRWLSNMCQYLVGAFSFVPKPFFNKHICDSLGYIAQLLSYLVIYFNFIKKYLSYFASVK